MSQSTNTVSLLLLFICATFLAGCSDDLTKSIQHAASDNVISPEECAALENIILSDKSSYKMLLSGDSVKSEALAKRIRWIVKKAIEIDCAKGETVKDSKANYEVYLENSGSMDGYVAGNTAFKNTLHTFLNNIQLPTNGLSDEMKFFYINSEKIPFNSSLQDFILNLNPKTFHERGGNRQTTDFVKLFDTLLKTGTDNKVVILITDGVLSPEKGKSAEDFLVNHRETIKTTFNRHLSSNKDFKTILLKLNSEFSGIYYDFKNEKHPLDKANRPYYIWLLGNAEQLDRLISKVEIPAETEHFLVFSATVKIPERQVLMSPKIGNYTKGTEANTLLRAKKATDGKNAGQFGFSASIDLTGYLFDTSHLLSPASYKVTPPSYALSVEPISEQDRENRQHLKNYSHYLKLQTGDLREESVSVQLKRELPGWVKQSNSTNDTGQAGDELHKTYGLLPMLTGISEAYGSAAKDPGAFFTLTFTIEK